MGKSYRVELLPRTSESYDQLQIRWEEGDNGRPLIGGGPNTDLQKAMLEGVIRALFRFMRFEQNYVVPDLDEVGVPKSATS